MLDLALSRGGLKSKWLRLFTTHLESHSLVMITWTLSDPAWSTASVANTQWVTLMSLNDIPQRFWSISTITWSMKVFTSYEARMHLCRTPKLTEKLDSPPSLTMHTSENNILEQRPVIRSIVFAEIKQIAECASVPHNDLSYWVRESWCRTDVCCVKLHT